MVDFPSSPVNNQTFNAGSRSWKYNGTAWERTITASHVNTVISGTVAEVVFDIPVEWFAIRLTAVGIRSSLNSDIFLQWRRSGQGTYDNAATNYTVQFIGRSTAEASGVVQSATSPFNSSCQISGQIASASAPRCTIDGVINTGTSLSHAGYVGLASGTNSGGNELMYTFIGRSAFTGSLDRIRIFPNAGSFNSGMISIQRIL